MSSFLLDAQELKPGLIVFRRSDVEHKNWYCRIKVPGKDQYKVVSLRTPNLSEARDKAYDHDVDVRFRIKHEVPIFDRPFRDVAEEYKKYLKDRVSAGELTLTRWTMKASMIDRFLVPYVGNVQISNVGRDYWDRYTAWRMETAKAAIEAKKAAAETDEQKVRAAKLTLPKHETLRLERSEFRSLLVFAAEKKKYIRESQVPKGKIPRGVDRREAFSPQEYRHLHTFARKWIKEARNEKARWWRTMIYNFALVMANTGMRPTEAKNLNWRDVDVRKDRQGREFVVLSVHGKGKARDLVATMAVANYLERIRKISKATKPNDPVFSTITGKRATEIFKYEIAELLTAADLLTGPNGTRRCSYSFRHTYATFRLIEGVDHIWLAGQMGTSSKMIEEHYGHITPSKNAERILGGMPGWDGSEDSEGIEGRVNAAPFKNKPTKSRKR